MRTPRATEKAARLRPILARVNVTPEQCRAARAFLNWPRRRLATVSGVSSLTILNFENGNSDTRQETLHALEDAFVAAGIEFFRNGLRFEG